MKRRIILVLGALLVAVSLPAQGPPGPPTPAPRFALSANVLGYEINPQLMTSFQGCLTTDKGCTMRLIVCYGKDQCISLPAATYPLGVWFQRTGGTEVPAGSLVGPVAWADVQVAIQ
jgi:hypothetical protein